MEKKLKCTGVVLAFFINLSIALLYGGQSSFVLSSPVVKEGEALPIEYTGFGESATLPLTWSGVPEGTKSFTLILHHIDPEGKIKWYWTLYNISGSSTNIPKNGSAVGTLGNNSVNFRAEYAPPHSKGGGEKIYIYTLYAISDILKIDMPAEKVSREVLLAAMKDKVLASAQLKVVFTRPETTEISENKSGDRPPPPPRDGRGRETPGVFELKAVDRPEFIKILIADAKLETIGDKFKFSEGPVWIKNGNYLLFSDVQEEKIYKWSKSSGLVVFREKSNGSNGNFQDKEGLLVTCEHNSRRITRTEKDGTIKVLADKYEGKLLNSPNDLTVSSDGSIWFTDPPYGLKNKKGELPGNYVFKLDNKGTLTAVLKSVVMPNGICFSPDEKYLYVADSAKENHCIIRYEMKEGLPSGESTFCFIDNKEPDGIRCDREGRLYVAAGDGIHIFSKEGKLIGKIQTPCWPTNLCFGGEDGKTFFITARQAVYSISLK